MPEIRKIIYLGKKKPKTQKNPKKLQTNKQPKKPAKETTQYSCLKTSQVRKDKHMHLKTYTL